VQCRTGRFVIIARGLSYGELVADAANCADAAPLKTQPIPADRQAGGAARYGCQVSGRAIFGIDVAVPGMLNARSRPRAPSAGSDPKQADILKCRAHAVGENRGATIANEDAGFRASVARHNAVCVVADHFWQAAAIDALDVTFDGGSDGDLSTAGINAS
jgi:hypothetical protein